ncbi:MAG: RNA polymerase sigma factor [Clostridia bacterium]|nr:RNA polymerase sigma factor [Clostridia bacterium]
MNSATGPDREYTKKITNIRQFPLEADIETWIEQYGNGLLRLCFLQLGDYALAEDAVQETFIRAWQHYDRFEHRSSVKTWITTIAVNVCRSLQRSPWRRRMTSLESIPELSESGEMPDFTVSQAVMKLPPDLKEVFLMHELQGMKLREIAEARHIPLATASSRLNRARKRLRRELKEWYPYEE